MCRRNRARHEPENDMTQPPSEPFRAFRLREDGQGGELTTLSLNELNAGAGQRILVIHGRILGPDGHVTGVVLVQ